MKSFMSIILEKLWRFWNARNLLPEMMFICRSIKTLQIAAYDLLEQEIAGIVYSNIESSGSEMNIPITDVYFALVNNNVIDIEHFSDEKATENEKAVLQIFSGRQQTVLVSDQRVEKGHPRQHLVHLERKIRIILLILSTS